MQFEWGRSDSAQVIESSPSFEETRRAGCFMGLIFKKAGEITSSRQNNFTAEQ